MGFRLRYVLCAVVFFLHIFLLTGCMRSQNQQAVVLPNVFDYSVSEEWAVLVDPYTSFFETPTHTAAIAAHARRGDVLIVLGNKTIVEDGKKKLWYQFSLGWLEASSVVLYSNKFKANAAAKKLR